MKLARFLIPLVVVAALLTAGCLAPPDPQAQVAAQIERGGPIYARDCATELCHGLQGEGLPSEDGFRVWPLVGEEFEARNPNAQVVFDVVRSGSESNLRALSDEEVYAAIAFELSQNDLQLTEPLGDGNAAEIASGAAVPTAAWGSLFPPPGNARLLPPPPAPTDLPQRSNEQLRLRVDQLARASVIGRSIAPSGGYYLIIVFALQNLGDGDLRVDPQFLSLGDTLDQAHPPAQANLAYPMERFHPITIRPGYGVAGYEIFLLPSGAEYDHLRYEDPSTPVLVVELR